MTAASEVVRLTKLCQRQRVTIKRLERDLAKAEEVALAYIFGVKPAPPVPKWDSVPHESLWHRFKAWVAT